MKTTIQLTWHSIHLFEKNLSTTGLVDHVRTFYWKVLQWFLFIWDNHVIVGKHNIFDWVVNCNRIKWDSIFDSFIIVIVWISIKHIYAMFNNYWSYTVNICVSCVRVLLELFCGIFCWLVASLCCILSCVFFLYYILLSSLIDTKKRIA